MNSVVTARDAAIRLIEKYVERGDSLASLKSGQQGSYCQAYRASIAGNLNGKFINSDKIVVTQVNGADVCEVFSLKDIYTECSSGVQGRLL